MVWVCFADFSNHSQIKMNVLHLLKWSYESPTPIYVPIEWVFNVYSTLNNNLTEYVVQSILNKVPSCC